LVQCMRNLIGHSLKGLEGSCGAHGESAGGYERPLGYYANHPGGYDIIVKLGGAERSWRDDSPSAGV